MKRSIALLISAAVTAFVLIAVLAVASPKGDASASAANGAGQDQVVTVVAPSTTGAPGNVAALQARLAVMQQREAAYQQRLQQAYAQLQAAQSQSAAAPAGGHGEHEGNGGGDD